MIEPLLQAERLLLHGLVDQAEELYRRTAEQDPQNAIAVVGLARVALERGDDELALEQARRALVIDPHNAAAIRLEARLSEVLTTRAGQQAELPADVPPRSSTSAGPVGASESEPVSFQRNRSMSEHRRVTERPPAQPRTEQSEPAAMPRRGLLARLLRRDRRTG